MQNVLVTFSGLWPDIAYVQAAKAYREEPDVRSPEVPKSEGWCAHCNKLKKMTQFKKCGQCQLTFYCDSRCQKANWPVHKNNCLSPYSSHLITMKLAERAIGTPHLWVYFDVISVITLDLLNKPQNASCHALDVSCVFVPTGRVDNSGRKEGIFQITDITPRHLSDIPSGFEMFEGTEKLGMNHHNMYFKEGNYFVNGATRTLQITRILPPVLLRIIQDHLGQQFFPVKRFGLVQIIPLQKDALVKCINQAIAGDKFNQLRLKAPIIPSKNRR